MNEAYSFTIGMLTIHMSTIITWGVMLLIIGIAGVGTRQMDILPNQINAYLQAGEFEKVLESKAIWVCVACFECGTRCPHKIDIAKINEALRQIKIRKNMDLYNIWEVASTGEFPTVALVASFRKFTA